MTTLWPAAWRIANAGIPIRETTISPGSVTTTPSVTRQRKTRRGGTLPLVRRLEVEGRRVLLCHGSPRKINEFVWESASPDQFLEYLLDQAAADVVCVTHTGIKWHRRLPGDRHFVNVGVLGRPENDGNTNVWYTLLSFDATDVRVEFVPVVYDFLSLASDMRSERLPDEFVETITTGWWTTCLEILPHKERARGHY